MYKGPGTVGSRMETGLRQVLKRYWLLVPLLFPAVSAVSDDVAAFFLFQAKAKGKER